jgi:hypothetical protein
MTTVPDDMTSGPSLTLLGSKLLDEGRLEDATRVFKRAASLYPTVPLVPPSISVKSWCLPRK